MSSDASISKNLTTNAYIYETFPIDEIRREDGFFLTFNVKAKQDALIIFSPTETPQQHTENVLEAIIGGYVNCLSFIRLTAAAGDEYAKHDEKHMLSATEWRQFWIRVSFNGSSIEVGKKDCRPFMTVICEPRTINYYGFAAWGSPVDWIISPQIKNNGALVSRNLRSTNYNYRVFPIDEIRREDGFFLTFDVKAERDAIIIFSPTQTPARYTEQVLEAIIGGYVNTRSMIRLAAAAGEEYSKHDEKHILSASEWRPFWIRVSLNGSSIEVGKKNRSPFMSMKCEPRSIKYYGFAGWGCRVDWVIRS